MNHQTKSTSQFFAAAMLISTILNCIATMQAMRCLKVKIDVIQQDDVELVCKDLVVD
jgi:hypothetical protein